jgi:hypothetical protein
LSPKLFKVGRMVRDGALITGSRVEMGRLVETEQNSMSG